MLVGLGAGLGYGHLQLGKEQQTHQKEMNLMNQKIALLTKKASDEREARSGSEGRNRSLQAEVDKLRKENGEQAEAIKKLEAEAQSSEAKLKETTEEVARMKSARDEVSAQLAQVTSGRQGPRRAGKAAGDRETNPRDLFSQSEPGPGHLQKSQRQAVPHSRRNAEKTAIQERGGNPASKRASDADRKSGAGKIHARVQGKNRTGEAEEELEQECSELERQEKIIPFGFIATRGTVKGEK